MGNERAESELLSLCDDLALDDDARFRLALVIGDLLFESFEEGRRAGEDSILSHGFKAATRIIYTEH